MADSGGKAPKAPYKGNPNKAAELLGVKNPKALKRVMDISAEDPEKAKKYFKVLAVNEGIFGLEKRLFDYVTNYAFAKHFYTLEVKITQGKEISREKYFRQVKKNTSAEKDKFRKAVEKAVESDFPTKRGGTKPEFLKVLLSSSKKGERV